MWPGSLIARWLRSVPADFVRFKRKGHLSTEPEGDEINNLTD